MADFRRPLHVRIAGILARMDAAFLERCGCYFGGGTQISLGYGEFRESSDIDFVVSSREGIRAIRETVSSSSLGKLFKAPIILAREVLTDRDAVRTFLLEEKTAKPVKFEIVYEGRIDLAGALNTVLPVPTLTPACAVAEKLLANADRGLDRSTYSRDAIDLAHLALALDEETFAKGYVIAVGAYGDSVPSQLNAALKRLELDAGYRNECISALAVEDPRRLRQGLTRLRTLKKTLVATGDR